MMSESGPWKAALIGAGKMGSYHYAKLMANPDFDLLAVCDPISEPKEVALYRDLRQLKDLELDVVFVASPTQTHYETLKQTLSWGLHAFVEKPAASSSDQCRELLSLAETKGLKLAVGHVERFNPVVQALRRVLACGVLSKPLFVNTKRAGGYPQSVKAGNDVLLDLAVHDFDLLQMLLGPLEVENAQLLESTSSIVDAASVGLRSRESVRVNVEVDWFSPQRKRQLEWFCPEATLHLDFISQTCKVVGGDLSALAQRLDLATNKAQGYDLLDVPVHAGDALALQLADFAAFLRSEPHSLATGEQLVAPVDMVEHTHLRGERNQPEAKWLPFFQRL